MVIQIKWYQEHAETTKMPAEEAQILPIASLMF